MTDTAKPGAPTSIIAQLWEATKFPPNESQAAAIFFDQAKPLFITAAPGSGKTRVLLWRTVRLIVENGIEPESIFLSTFTEKAAHQLKEGLKELLGMASNITGKKYDLARMYVGTIHSNCQRILNDRAFSLKGERRRPPSVMDGFGQYLFVRNRKFFAEMLAAAGLEDTQETYQKINAALGTVQQANSKSRHFAVINLVSLFNRLSEELADPAKLKSEVPFNNQLYSAYNFYKNSLSANNTTDLSLLQAEALALLNASPTGSTQFSHVIIDEYQDTNTVQEQLVFTLAKGSKNLCVVGDDDQALYRFRGATVENFVDFPIRCEKYYGIKPHPISLSINYRSLPHIVEKAHSYIHKTAWKHGPKEYRIPKTVTPNRKHEHPSVFTTEAAAPDIVAPKLAQFIVDLKNNGAIKDYNQVAVLFSYLKGNKNVARQAAALEGLGVPVYKPRAGCFLDLDESLAVFGVFMKVLGQPSVFGQGRDIGNFRTWVTNCVAAADELITNDSLLKAFIEDKALEVSRSQQDYVKLKEFCTGNSWEIKSQLSDKQLFDLSKVTGISKEAASKLSSFRLLAMVQSGSPKATVSYALNRATSLEFGLLDLFYQLTMFGYFKGIIDKASNGQDEGPICNLSLITQYISRYQEDRGYVTLSGYNFEDDRLLKSFFGSYLLAMHRLGETEFEDKEDPFPKGRVSFITIHQAKGLEFPVVILGGLYRQDHGAGSVETLIRNEVRTDGEPLDKISNFDTARLFYVALSRAQNVLVLPRYKGRGCNILPEFQELLTESIPEINTVDWTKVEKPRIAGVDIIGKSYSYTSDYILYKRCPRQYMLFRKHGFVPARSQMMLFGSLVHQTIEDLHNHLLANQT